MIIAKLSMLLLSSTLFAFLLFCPPFFALSEKLQIGGYQCYLLCLSQCLKTNKSFQIVKDDADSCWKSNCKISSDKNSSIALTPPTHVRANYLNISLSQRKVVVEWTQVPNASLYTIEYYRTDLSQKLHQTDPLRRLVTDNTSIEMEKEMICSEYLFRVAAVDDSGVSEFSNITSLPMPPAETESPKAKLIDSVLRTVPYFSQQESILSNDSVRITIEYVPPTGWSLQDKEREILFGMPFLVDCKSTPFSFNLGKPIYDKDNKPFVYYDFPSFVVEERCRFIFTRDAKCGYQEMRSISTPLLIEFNCSNTRNASCIEEIIKHTGPYCNFFINTSTSATINNRGYVPVTLTWQQNNKDPLKCFHLKIREMVKPPGTADILFDTQLKISHQFAVRCVCDLVPISSNKGYEYKLIIDDLFEPAKLYSFELCGSFEENMTIDWLPIEQLPMTLTYRFLLAVEDPRIVTDHSDSKLTVNQWIGIGFGIVGCFSFLIIIAIVIYKFKNRTVSPSDNFGIGKEVFANKNDYVDLPRHVDPRL